MQIKQFADLKLSELMLGTVQFGLDYGIANHDGQVPYDVVRDILSCAYEAGVNCLDTAAVYGTSEEVLGKALSELGISGDMVIVSKIHPMAEEFSSLSAVDDFVEESVMRSLKRLRIDVLPICLFHDETNSIYAESLLKLKDKGLVRHIGSSVMTPAVTSSIISSGLVETLQIPSNLLDQRFVRKGIYQAAKKCGIGIFVRSIYLQGLILMPEDEIIRELREVIPIRRQLRCLAKDAGMALAELAVRYVLGLDGLTCALVGANTVEQIRQNLALFAKGPLDPDLMAAVDDMVPGFADETVMPTEWSRRMPDVVRQKR